MLRNDWWWPWWVSSLFDLGVIAIAVVVLLASSHRNVRLVAGAFVVLGLVAAVMAPIVMTEDSDAPMDTIERGESPEMVP
jgi:membrane-associated PAP2 superfamily phosphatase